MTSLTHGGDSEHKLMGRCSTEKERVGQEQEWTPLTTVAIMFQIAHIGAPSICDRG